MRICAMVLQKHVCAVSNDIVRTELYGLATEEESEGLTLVWSSILETE